MARGYNSTARHRSRGRFTLLSPGGASQAPKLPGKRCRTCKAEILKGTWCKTCKSAKAEYQRAKHKGQHKRENAPPARPERGDKENET